jgi:calcineurin-like phosphoesterase
VKRRRVWSTYVTGDYDSIIGMQKDEPMRRFTSGIPSGVATLSGVAVETDDATGLAVKVAPVRMGAGLSRRCRSFGWGRVAARWR